MTPGAGVVRSVGRLRSAILLAYVLHSLRLSTDLRLFLPRPATPEQALVLEGIGEGPAARLLMIALEGGEPAALARHSHALAAGLREDAGVSLGRQRFGRRSASGSSRTAIY